ncbi:DUF2336 domain-containing protein [Aureimonas sp. Leaf454]|uniref:DUF2336 domain-containing protein n=1 Tax=Aureimonas sp. Leaf454 TaxID=1736381 RepID=UPI0006F4BDB8|nr:DUF2336 domain-containing protein [Aureimonas sp. Leaf454]
MDVQRFVTWCETASAKDRAGGAEMLAAAFAAGHLEGEDHTTGLVALGHFLDDPSPKVRRALADALATSTRAPRRIVLALADDVDDVACPVVSASPVLLCSDLVDLFAYGSPRLRAAVTSREDLSRKVSAAIVEIGSAAEVADVIDHPAADITPCSLRRAAERLGDDADVRGCLLARADLPLDVRQQLLLEAGQALSRMALVRNTVGERRTDKLILESCEAATVDMAGDVRPSHMATWVEHLRRSGQLSTAFLIRIVCAGQVDLFTASLVALSGLSERRVRAIVVDGRQGAFDALMKTAGLPDASGPLLRTAIRLWKRIANEDRPFDDRAMPSLVMSRLADVFAERRDEPGFEAVMTLLRRLETETVRRSVRQTFVQLAAA